MVPEGLFELRAVTAAHASGKGGGHPVVVGEEVAEQLDECRAFVSALGEPGDEDCCGDRAVVTAFALVKFLDECHL